MLCEKQNSLSRIGCKMCWRFPSRHLCVVKAHFIYHWKLNRTRSAGYPLQKKKKEIKCTKLVNLMSMTNISFMWNIINLLLNVETPVCLEIGWMIFNRAFKKWICSRRHAIPFVERLQKIEMIHFSIMNYWNHFYLQVFPSNNHFWRCPCLQPQIHFYPAAKWPVSYWCKLIIDKLMKIIFHSFLALGFPLFGIDGSSLGPLSPPWDDDDLMDFKLSDEDLSPVNDIEDLLSCSPNSLSFDNEVETDESSSSSFGVKDDEAVASNDEISLATLSEMFQPESNDTLWTQSSSSSTNEEMFSLDPTDPIWDVILEKVNILDGNCDEKQVKLSLSEDFFWQLNESLDLPSVKWSLFVWYMILRSFPRENKSSWTFNSVVLNHNSNLFPHLSKIIYLLHFRMILFPLTQLLSWRLRKPILNYVCLPRVRTSSQVAFWLRIPLREAWKLLSIKAIAVFAKSVFKVRNCWKVIRWNSSGKMFAVSVKRNWTMLRN